MRRSSPRVLVADIITADMVPLSALLPLLPTVRTFRVYVYTTCAGDNVVDVDLRVLPKIKARVAQIVRVCRRYPATAANYVEHVFQHYHDQKADVSIFLGPEFDGTSTFFAVEQMSRDTEFMCLMPSNALRSSDLEKWQTRKDLWRSRKKVTDLQNNFVEGTKAPLPTLCTFLSQHLVTADFLRLKRETYFNVCHGNSFVVSRRGIQNISRKSWESILKSLNEEGTNDLSFFIELSWGSLLSKKMTRFATLSQPGMFHSLPQYSFSLFSFPFRVRRAACSVIVLPPSTDSFFVETQLAQKMVRDKKHVLILSPPTSRLDVANFEYDGVDVDYWDLLQAPRGVSISDVTDYISEKYDVDLELIIFSSIVWANSVRQRERSSFLPKQIIWIIKEWAITPDTAVEFDKGFHWFGDTHPEILPGELRSTLLQADAIIFSSFAQRKLWTSADIYNSYVIPGRVSPKFPSGNSLHTRSNVGVPEHTTLLISVGEQNMQHRQLWAVAALNTLLLRGIDATLILVGHRSAKFHSDLSRASLDRAKLILLPHQEDLSGLYMISDLYICTGSLDAVPASTMQAMAEGLPVVATKFAGVSELFQSTEVNWAVDVVFSKERAEELFVTSVIEMVDKGREFLKNIGAQMAEAVRQIGSKSEDDIVTLFDVLQQEVNEAETCGI